MRYAAVASFLDHHPVLGPGASVDPAAAVVGRTSAGAGLVCGPYVALRGDGEAVRLGERAWFGARSTAHITHEALPAVVGDDVTVGAFGLVHACTLGRGVVVGEAATVMDGSVVGPWAVIAAGSVVPPRKSLEGGMLHAGHPAVPVRTLDRAEVEAMAAALRAGRPPDLLEATWLPPLDAAPFGARARRGGPRPAVGDAFVAGNALLAGDVRVADDAGVYFGCVLDAGDATIDIGARTNVQDNSILATDARRGDLVVAADVTIGHNVRLGSGRIGAGALIGMAAVVGDEVVVEPGGCIAAGAHVAPQTTVRAGWIWAGRPAVAFRELKPAEREAFAAIIGTYVGYGRGFRGRA